MTYEILLENYLLWAQDDTVSTILQLAVARMVKEICSKDEDFETLCDDVYDLCSYDLENTIEQAIEHIRKEGDENFE